MPSGFGFIPPGQGRSPEDWRSNPTKVRFLNLRSRETLAMMYNPEGLSTSEEAKWSEVTVPGAPDVYHQFVSGGAFSFGMSLFLNEFKEGRNYERGYVENSILFLREAMISRDLEYGGRIIRQAPDVVRVFWGQIKFSEPAPGINVIITAMNVDRIMFDGDTGNAVRAFVDLELKRFSFV